LFDKIFTRSHYVFRKLHHIIAIQFDIFIFVAIIHDNNNNERMMNDTFILDLTYHRFIQSF